VWQWQASKMKWAFYSPSFGDGGASYALGKGYDLLTLIGAGDGFWVNAKSTFSMQLPSGAMITSASFQNMPSGWNLVAVGDSPTPSWFNTALSVTPPSAGDTPIDLITLWAWDYLQGNWYFYAPNLEKNGTLSSFIQSNNYLEFGTNKHVPVMGFWVNRP